MSPVPWSHKWQCSMSGLTRLTMPISHVCRWKGSEMPFVCPGRLCWLFNFFFHFEGDARQTIDQRLKSLGNYLNTSSFKQGRTGCSGGTRWSRRPAGRLGPVRLDWTRATLRRHGAPLVFPESVGSVSTDCWPGNRTAQKEPTQQDPTASTSPATLERIPYLIAPYSVLSPLPRVHRVGAESRDKPSADHLRRPQQRSWRKEQGQRRPTTWEDSEIVVIIGIWPPSSPRRTSAPFGLQ